MAFKRFILALLTLACIVVFSGCAATYYQAMTLDGKVPKDAHEALKWMQPLAGRGDAVAQNNIGLLYLNGEGVPQNYQEALKWFGLAALQGNVSAQHNIGLMYHNGWGVSKDLLEALYWFRLAASQGYSLAQIKLNQLPELIEAAQQLNAIPTAAARGDAVAQSQFGWMYFIGLGVPQNYQEALKWFRLAALQGNVSAQNYIGVIFYDGLGVSKDYQEALKWFRLAAARGLAVAQNNLQLPEMIQAAQQSAPSISSSQNTVESKIDNNSINQAKMKCIDLGFKKNTEAFGNCVLKLSK